MESKIRRKSSVGKRDFVNYGEQILKFEFIQFIASRLNLPRIKVLLAYEKFCKDFPEGSMSKEDFMNENKV